MRAGVATRRRYAFGTAMEPFSVKLRLVWQLAAANFARNVCPRGQAFTGLRGTDRCIACTRF
jgi:hypothetical protein